MIFIIFFISLITKFVNLYDITILLISNIFIVCTIYYILKKGINSKLKNALVVSILEIPVYIYILITKRGIGLLYLILEILLCYFLFIGLAELSRSSKISKLCNITLLLCVIQIFGVTVMCSIWFIPPGITSKMTWIFVFIGVIITIFGSIIISQVMKRLKSIKK